MVKNLYNKQEGGTMKKILSIVVLMVVVMFVGCGNEKNLTNLENKVNELQIQIDNLNTAMDNVVEDIDGLKKELQKKNIIKKEVLKPPTGK